MERSGISITRRWFKLKLIQTASRKINRSTALLCEYHNHSCNHYSLFINHSLSALGEKRCAFEEPATTACRLRISHPHRQAGGRAICNSRFEQ